MSWNKKEIIRENYDIIKYIYKVYKHVYNQIYNENIL